MLWKALYVLPVTVYLKCVPLQNKGRILPCSQQNYVRTPCYCEETCIYRVIFVCLNHKRPPFRARTPESKWSTTHSVRRESFQHLL